MQVGKRMKQQRHVDRTCLVHFWPLLMHCSRVLDSTVWRIFKDSVCVCVHVNITNEIWFYDANNTRRHSLKLKIQPNPHNHMMYMVRLVQFHTRNLGTRLFESYFTGITWSLEDAQKEIVVWLLGVSSIWCSMIQCDTTKFDVKNYNERERETCD